MKKHLVFVLAVVAALGLNMLLIQRYPLQRTWGDETYYTDFSHRDLTLLNKIKRLVPGNMYFTWWKPLPYGIYGLISNRNLTLTYVNQSSQYPHPAGSGDVAVFLKRVSFLNLSMLIVAGLNIYVLCLSLGFGRGYAAAASALFFFNPRILFYVQSLWPELLHMVLITTAMLLLIFYHLRSKPIYLISSGMVFGYCSLTKGIAGIFILVILPVFFVDYYLRSGRNARFFFKTVVLFYLSYAVIILPQKVNNYYEHNTFSISTNTWINIERGIIPGEEVEEGLFHRYFTAADDATRREALSRQRVIAYIRQGPASKIVAKQLNMFVARQLNDSFLMKGFLENRWSGPRSAAMERTAKTLSVILSWGLMVFGVCGLVLRFHASFGMTLISLYLIYYIASLFVVGFNPRFFVQAVPFLGIMAISLLGAKR